MKYDKSKKYEKFSTGEYLMGPNCFKMMEELTDKMDLYSGMRVLDLGCGTGMTSMFLAKEFGVTVYAVDLWIQATDNYRRIRENGLDGRVIPLHADANDLPFAEEYFDAVTSVDAYYYFGMNDSFFAEKLVPLVKPGGSIGIAMPGYKRELQSVPDEMLLSWTAEDLSTFHCLSWWQKLLQSEKAPIVEAFELECCEQAWADWLASDNPYAVRDRPAMEAGAGKYMSLLAFISKKR